MRSMNMILALGAALTLAAPGASASPYRDTSVPMKTQEIDLQSYLGKWYEIARYPNNFERGCTNVTAQYGLQDDGAVSVVNSCNGKTRKAEAVPVGPGKFEVDFVSWLPGIGKGDYWVLYVDPGYDLAVVGEPTGRYGWILSRTPQIRQSALDQAKSVLEANGYDTSEIMLVPQG